MSFIKLTNATTEREGKELILNSRYIVSVFSIQNQKKKDVTIIGGALQSSWESWEVKESIATVWDMIQKASETNDATRVS